LAQLAIAVDGQVASFNFAILLNASVYWFGSVALQLPHKENISKSFPLLGQVTI
jgi:hypothetical protein